VGSLERMSHYLLLKKATQLKYTMEGFKELLNPYRNIIESLTLDNGVENVRYQELNLPTYFCHPYSSWEKGSMEHGFKRLRRFIPKKTSLKNISQEKLSTIMETMNHTPRKCLNWRTPKEVFEEQIKLKRQPKANNYFKVGINKLLTFITNLTYPQCRA